MVEMLDVLMGPRDASTADHPWHRVRGELATSVLQSEVAPTQPRRPDSRCGATSTTGCCVACSRCTTTSSGGSASCTPRATAQGLLTNSFKEFRDHIEAHVDFGVFDVVVDSSVVGLRKPEPEIYALTTELHRRAGGARSCTSTTSPPTWSVPRPPGGRRST